MDPWNDMTLEEKVGQLMMVGFTGTEPSQPLKQLLQERHVGGVILFFRNIRDGAHVSELTSQLQSLARRPLLISADQEGGSVLRVRQGASLLPSAMGLGRLGYEAVQEAATIAGDEMRAMGINLNLAPVLDINSPENPGIGIRSYGESAEHVARMAEAYVKGIQGAGTLACVKHFPGKGAARLDAHLDLPKIDRSAEELRAKEYKPFVAAFAAGAAAAMTSHCVYPQLDKLPATLSSRILTGLLRDEMDFQGILITDDMEMGAIAKYHEGAAAAVAAFAAGADQLLICHDHALQRSSQDAIVAALKSGQIPMSRLEKSLARIRAAKERVGRRGDVSVAELSERHAPKIQQLCDRISEVSRDPERRLPLTGEAVDVYWPNMSVLTMVEEGGEGEDLVRQAFQAKFRDVSVTGYNPKEPAAVNPRAGRAAVFFSANAHLFPAQAKLIEEVRKTSGRFVLVALRNPYDQDLVPAGETAVLSYGFLPNALKATLGVLFGQRA